MSKLGKEGHKHHFRKVFKSLNAKNEQCCLFKWAVAGAESGAATDGFFLSFF